MQRKGRESEQVTAKVSATNDGTDEEREGDREGGRRRAQCSVQEERASEQTKRDCAAAAVVREREREANVGCHD